MHRFSEPAKTVGEEEEETFGKEGKYITARSHLEEICGGGGGNGRTATGTAPADGHPKSQSEKDETVRVAPTQTGGQQMET